MFSSSRIEEIINSTRQNETTSEIVADRVDLKLISEISEVADLLSEIFA